MLSKITLPILVDSRAELSDAIEELRNEPCIAVDTESNSLYAYKEKVCLIQISSPTMDFLFDPLKLNDLSSLGTLFENAQQEKIFHASEYDLICLKRDYHFTFNNIFDTLIASRILGKPQVGLGALLNNYFGIEVDKRFQRADWGKRPLSDAMLNYARLDTCYLFKLRDCLEKELKDAGLLNLACEDFKLACKVEARQQESHQNGCWKVAGSNRMNPKQAAVLAELCAYREEQAQKFNLPLFKVLSDKLLMDVSRICPKTLDELTEIPGCSEKIIFRHGSGLLHAVYVGENNPPPVRKHNPKPDEEFLIRLDKLKEWRKLTAKEMSVESDVVLPRETLERIASANPKNLPDLKKVMAEAPVRYQKYGKLIIKALRSKEKP